MTSPIGHQRDLHEPDDIGAVIRELRQHKGWSQAELAEWLDVSRPTVIRLERGQATIALAQAAIQLLGAKLAALPKGGTGT
jgi:transcriptional regulator with XRE-family HTH domain